MEKKLLPALILTLLAGTAMAMDDAAKADKAMTGASSDRNTSNDASASDSNVDSAQWAVLTADPKTTLFLRLDADNDGLLSNEEISAGKELLTLDVRGANADTAGVNLIDFKTALSNSMLGLGGTTMASSPAGGSTTAGGSTGTSASTDSDRDVQGADVDSTSGGMLSDKIMEETQDEGGPTVLRGGPNPSPDALTPEQKLNKPDAGAGTQ